MLDSAASPRSQAESLRLNSGPRPRERWGGGPVNGGGEGGGRPSAIGRPPHPRAASAPRRRRRGPPARRLPRAPGPPKNYPSAERQRPARRRRRPRRAVPRAPPAQRSAARPPRPPAGAWALRGAATPFPARPGGRKQLQPPAPGPGPPGPSPFTFWMAAGVISPFPRCLGAANATDMSGRYREGPPPPPSSRAPRNQPAAGGGSDPGRTLRAKGGAGAAAQRDGPSPSRRGRVKGDRLLLPLSRCEGEPREAAAAPRRSAKTTAPRVGAAPFEHDLPFSRDLPGYPFPSAALVRSCPTRLSAGQAAKWYGRRGGWERCGAHVTGDALRLCRAARSPPPSTRRDSWLHPGSPLWRPRGAGRGGAAGTSGRR